MNSVGNTTALRATNNHQQQTAKTKVVGIAEKKCDSDYFEKINKISWK